MGYLVFRKILDSPTYKIKESELFLVKKCLLFASALLLFPVTTFASEKPLYKFVDNAGVYEYDKSQPIYFYQGSTEQIFIPEDYVQSKEQFKSTWIATIDNLNIPKPKDEQDFKNKYLERIQTLKDWNMNAIIFQVRPLLDAFYPSEINPSSQFLVEEQGDELDYDPLEWMVQVAHDNGMEYHAWLNPYRVTNSKLTSATVLNKLGLSKEEVETFTIKEQIEAFNRAGLLADNNYAVLHPENVLRFDEKLFLNPGIPEVIHHVQETVNELVTNYDIDAVHFDDYFYPYRLSDTQYFGQEGEDRKTFEQYGIEKGYADTEEGLENWRRDNVTELIKAVKSTIENHNHLTGNSVQFGISPFGIWEHIDNDERGSHTPTSSSQSYSQSIYADTYKWIKEELVDYMAPQIYWSFGQAAAPYGELTRWWNNVAEGTNVQIYIGHANYKHLGNGSWDAEWMNPEEIFNQMKFNQNYQSVQGSILFSYNDIIPSDLNEVANVDLPKHKVKNQSIELLRTEGFNTPSLIPSKRWLSHEEVVKPQKLRIDDGYLTWEDTQNQYARFYIVYAGDSNEDAKKIISEPGNIITKVASSKEKKYLFELPETDQAAQYIVTTVDKAQVESEPISIMVNEEVESLHLSAKSLEIMKKGKQMKVDVEVTPKFSSQPQLFWQVQNENIVSIDEHGVLSAKANGTTRVTVSAMNGVSASFTVRVSN